MLGYRVDVHHNKEQFRQEVQKFQEAENHENQDGLFGPGTRRLLAEVLCKRIGDEAFSRMKDPEKGGSKTVFLSYAWKDADKVNKIDQWLRDRGVVVRRDNRDFMPGEKLPESITDAIVECDKVIAVYSQNSKSRDWPRFELSVAEQQERTKGRSIIIYLKLDQSLLPKHDPLRIAVVAKGRRLKEFGEQLLNGILEAEPTAPRYDYDEDEVFN